MKHKIKKFDDKNILRGMLLNINDNSIFTADDYKLDLNSFNCLIKALLDEGVIGCQCELPVTDSEKLYIKNIELFEQWSKSNFTKQLNALTPYITIALSLVPIIAELFKNI